MDISKQFLQKSGYVSKISFKKTPVATFILESEKEETIKTDDGMVSGIQYSVLQAGEKKTIFTGSLSLIQQLSEFKKGDTVTVKCSSRKTPNGYRTIYKVVAGTVEPQVAPEDDDEDPNLIPF